MSTAYIEIPNEGVDERLEPYEIRVGGRLRWTVYADTSDQVAAFAQAIVAEIQAGNYRILVEECTIREASRTPPPTPAKRRFWKRS